MAFETHQPNLDSMQQYLQSERSREDGPKWWSIPSGMSVVRILPPWDPTGRIALPVFMHPIEYKDDTMKFTKYNWTCVNKTFNKPCPICEGLASMIAAGVDVSRWEASKRNFYINAIIMHDPTYNQKDKGVAPGTHAIMRVPKTFYDWVIAQITNPMIGDITNLTQGIDVYVTKEGSGLGTTYNMTLSPNGRTAVPQEYLDKIQSLYNLDEVFSAGFEGDQIDKLVAHLKRSAGVMSTAIPQTVNTMAGYPPQTPVVPVPSAPQTQVPVPPMQPNSTGVVPPTPFNNVVTPVASTPSTQVNIPLATPAVATPSTQVVNPVVSTPVAPVQTSEATPKCFGQYDPAQVNCVVCPSELACQQSRR